MELVGYARACAREDRRVFDRQADALRATGCERIDDDQGSGVSIGRPGLKSCLDDLREGDVLVDLDRLGQLAGELIRLVDELETREVGFPALDTSFNTMTPMGRAFLQVQAAFAEMERNVIRQRVEEGIAAAHARGRRKSPHGCCLSATIRTPCGDGPPNSVRAAPVTRSR